MKIKDDNTQCSGCGLCESVCKKDAITMREKDDGFRYPVINSSQCINCGACVKQCPFDKDKSLLVASNKTIESYLFKHSDEIRKNSASGGFFTLLSDYILEKGGVVYGAIFDENYQVVHVRADNKQDRNAMRGSKYVQSTMAVAIYESLRADVGEGKLVLFTGTPCQCAAVSELFKGKRPENLIIMDLICHGVLGNRFFEEYINDIKIKNQEHLDIANVNFRDKEFGWQESSVTFSDGFKFHGSQDRFYLIYAMNALQRASCFNCVFSVNSRIGDFTVGDFWGMKDSYPELYDDLGVSIVLVNSQNAKCIMDDLKKDSNAIIKRIYKEEYEKFQPNLKHPTQYGTRAKKFKQYYDKYGYSKTIHRFFDVTWHTRINSLIYSVLKRFI